MIFKKMFNFILRLTLCTFTFHKKNDVKVQAHKGFNVYICERCGNLFGVKKRKE